jgi:UDP-galactopyranose mutase
VFDFLIVGAGFAGSVLAERIATQLNKKVLIVDKRNHIGGNAYDYYNENGILVHKYGPHIFHTNSKKVIDYLSQFTDWRPYFHRVLAVVEGKKVPVPFNLNSIYELFPQKYAIKLEEELIRTFGYGQKVPILKLRETSNRELKFLADYIYNNVFYGYTLKQWELKPEELDPSVTARVPVYVSRDNRYFQDTYQLMPKEGYTKMFERMLSHKNIKILLNTDYKEIIDIIKFNKIIFTGPIDEFFDYQFGELPYRSLVFDFQSINSEYYQEVGQINYPNNNTFTRITEFKHITGQNSPITSIAYEYPMPFDRNSILIPYYPIPKEENNKLYLKYLTESEKLKNVIFCGRLADYKYYNMDQIIARALNIFEKEISL